MPWAWVFVLAGAGLLLWWISRLSAKIDRRAAAPAVMLPGNGEFECEVRGESHYQPALERAAGRRTTEAVEHYCDALLLPEPNNRHDRHAIAVYINGLQVGYISRDFAQEVGRLMRRQAGPGASVGARAVIRGGWDRGMSDRGQFGVWLDIPLN